MVMMGPSVMMAVRDDDDDDCGGRRGSGGGLEKEGGRGRELEGERRR